MAVQKTYLSVELADGTEHEALRITIREKLAWQKASKANGWDLDDPIQMPIFCAWKTLKTEGKYEGSYEQFRDTDLIDIAADEDDQAGPTEPTTI